MHKRKTEIEHMRIAHTHEIFLYCFFILWSAVHGARAMNDFPACLFGHLTECILAKYVEGRIQLEIKTSLFYASMFEHTNLPSIKTGRECKCNKNAPHF